MCGIAGILGLDSIEDARSRVGQMMARMSHRGPDDEGLFSGRGITLGHKRLSVIDLSPSGRQPMASFDGRYQIVYNGMLYNYHELKSLISDYPFRSQTDTEVVLAAYLKWGKDALERFDGMFAFAVWDNERRELFAARDQIGIKPFYFAHSLSNSRLIFSSELRALLASGLVPRRVDPKSLVDFLRYQTVHAPYTMVQDVHMLLPGHYLICSNRGLQINEYWNLSRRVSGIAQDGRQPPQEIRQNIRSILFDSVKRRLASDVPVGIFLSGGIDSSSIAGLASEARREIDTFTVTFDEDRYNEAEYARRVAGKFKTRHHEIKLTSEGLIGELPRALQAMDHPSGDGINTYLISKAVKQAGITVALSGLGGDEIFAGYPVFRRAAMFSGNQWIWNLPLAIRQWAGESARKWKPGAVSEKIAQVLMLTQGDFASIYPKFRQVFWDEDVCRLTQEIHLPPNRVEQITCKEAAAANGAVPFLGRVSAAEFATYMQNILLRDSDQMGMAHALEIRVPFLDCRLAEYVLGLADSAKKGPTPKRLLVESLSPLLPREIVKRPKMGFVLPWPLWLKKELRPFCASRIRSLAQRKELDGGLVLRLWDDFLAGDQRIRWSGIWSLIILGHWLTENGVGE
jgi:asparagine synthase (glutamine-hydrolysing)